MQFSCDCDPFNRMGESNGCLSLDDVRVFQDRDAGGHSAPIAIHTDAHTIWARLQCVYSCTCQVAILRTFITLGVLTPARHSCMSGASRHRCMSVMSLGYMGYDLAFGDQCGWLCVLGEAPILKWRQAY